MIKLKDLIIEGNDDCEELFGKYLFGQYKKFYGSEKEKDTEFERITFDAILMWVQSAGRRQVTQKYLDKLMKCKEKYPKILKPSKTIYYRVCTLPTDKYDDVKKIIELERNSFNGDFWENDKKRNKLLKFVNFSMDYKPQYKLESWTTSKSSAFSFTAGGFKHVKVEPAARGISPPPGATFIIKAKIPENELLFNPKFMNKISKDAGWGAQNEIIRLSKNKSSIKVNACYVSLLPQLHELWWYEIPKNVKSKIVGEIKSKWSSF